MRLLLLVLLSYLMMLVVSVLSVERLLVFAAVAGVVVGCVGVAEPDEVAAFILLASWILFYCCCCCCGYCYHCCCCQSFNSCSWSSYCYCPSPRPWSQTYFLFLSLLPFLVFVFAIIAAVAFDADNGYHHLSVILLDGIAAADDAVAGGYTNRRGMQRQEKKHQQR